MRRYDFLRNPASSPVARPQLLRLLVFAGFSVVLHCKVPLEKHRLQRDSRGVPLGRDCGRKWLPRMTRPLRVDGSTLY
jgi:hypothetical protein